MVKFGIGKPVNMRDFFYNLFFDSRRKFSVVDLFVLLGLISLLYAGVELASTAPEYVTAPNISTSPEALPVYAFFSLLRMTAAYILSVGFTLVYGRMAAYNKKAEKYMLPVLDVLQSVPILSFLPVVVLSLRAILPQGIAVELGSIVLIFTSQVWNMTFAWYQSLTTIPKDLQEAAAVNRFSKWQRFTRLEFPFGMISFIWNSMMSWAGGLFFLMAAEIFTVGDKDFRLPGLGSFLHEASDKGDYTAILQGIAALVLIVVLLDQLLWRPLLAWSEKFKLEMVSTDDPPRSWFYSVLTGSNIISRLTDQVLTPLVNRLDVALDRRSGEIETHEEEKKGGIMGKVVLAVFLVAILASLTGGMFMLAKITVEDWMGIIGGVFATFLRVLIALLIALAWTIPVGVLIANNRKIARFLQPLIQIFAAVPATALFPVVLMFLVSLPFGINLASILLMLMGTQWYLLFNIIAGASAIPADLKNTTKLLQLGGFKRWKSLTLPALFPYIITGAIAAGGGAWNASVVAEFVTFNGKTLATEGIGASIAKATAEGNFPVLLASTLLMVLAVGSINRLFWRRLYNLAEDRFKMD